MLILQALIQTLLQLIVFLFLPFLWWTFGKKENGPFIRWIGLKKPVITDKKKFLWVVILILIVFPALQFLVMPAFLESSNLASSQFEGSGMTMIVPILLYAFIQTGLAEEILFRGFLLKRTSGKFGFTVGNLIQALMFGLLHGVMFYAVTGLEGAVIITLITGATGWFMGYLNEKMSSGSIVPSWILHGLTNLVVSLLSAFNYI